MEKNLPHKADPFRVPAGYADEFTARLMARVDAMAAASREATTLSTPAAPAPIDEAPHAEPKPTSQQSTWRIVTRWLAGVAAVVALFFAFVHIQNLRPDAPQTANNLSTSGTEIASSNADLVYDYMLMTDQKVYGYATESDQ